MARFAPKDWKQLLGGIDPNDVYRDEDITGLEPDPHLTLMYGFEPEVDGSEVVNYMAGGRWPKSGLKVNLLDISTFQKEKYDVLKLGVELTPELRQIRDDIEASGFPYKSTHPVYDPHLTIGYLVKGTAAKYCGKLGGRNIPTPKLWSGQLHYSGPGGHVHRQMELVRLPTLQEFHPTILPSSISPTPSDLWPLITSLP